MIQDATYDPRVQELECRVQRVRGRLITHGVPLAKRAAKQYRTHLEPEQIEQEAMVGLIRAVDTYDSSKGASFSTWLHRHVRWAVMEATRQEHPVHLSQKANTKYLTYRRTLEALTQRLGATPTDEELASEMGEAVTEVRRIAAYVPDVAPLDEEDEDSSLTIEQSTPATANHYAITVPGAEDPFDFSYVAEAVLDALTEREALLLDASEGITGPKGTRRSLAAFLELPEQKIKADLERVRYRLRKNTWLLEFKRTMGYVTQAEHDAAVRARDARLPKHPAGAPIVPRPRPPRRPPAPVAKFYLGTRELGELEGRCHAKYRAKRTLPSMAFDLAAWEQGRAQRHKNRITRAWQDAAYLEERARARKVGWQTVAEARAYAQSLDERVIGERREFRPRAGTHPRMLEWPERFHSVFPYQRWGGGEPFTEKDAYETRRERQPERGWWPLPQGEPGVVLGLTPPREITAHDRSLVRTGWTQLRLSAQTSP